MRNPESITDLIIHGSWTPPGMDVGAAEIRSWHVEGNGWSDIGYHYVIRRSGHREEGRPWHQVGAHVSGHNATSLGIVLVGGMDPVLRHAFGTQPDLIRQELAWEFNYTSEQMAELAVLIADLALDFPNIERLRGHRDYPDVRKRCPGFEVREYFETTARVYGWEV